LLLHKNRETIHAHVSEIFRKLEIGDTNKNKMITSLMQSGALEYVENPTNMSLPTQVITDNS
jgi:DNA-binding NarL/FixJ family response regulator